MKPINDNLKQNELSKLFMKIYESQIKIGNELVVMSSIVRDIVDKITEIDAWNT